MVWVYKNAGFHADVNNFNMEKSFEKISGSEVIKNKNCLSGYHFL
jgi:hypothetical protein